MKTFILFASILVSSIAAHAQGTAFTYQGRLQNNGGPANGAYDFRFKLAADPFGNDFVGGNVFTNGVSVNEGLFTVTLDFDGAFNGSNYWLEIAVRTNGGGGYTALAPLQALTPTPYAIFAAGASNVLGIVPSGGLSGGYNTAVNFNNAANNFTGSFHGNGAGLSNVNAAALGGLGASNFWQLAGNAVAPGAFLGSLNNQPVEFRANNQRALRLESAGASVNVIGGWSNNAATPGVTQATIGGGGGESVVSPGTFFTNRVLDSYGTIAGGLGNVAGNANLDFADARAATVGGGAGNTAAGAFSTASGGQNNTATNAYSTVGGGGNNAALALSSVIAGGFQNQTLATDAAIVGGYLNTAAGYRSFIGGGTANVISNQYAVIGGGHGNSAAGAVGTIGGGEFNTANGAYDTVAGGYQNVAFGNWANVSGGGWNTNVAQSAAIGGGWFNHIEALAQAATVSGGYNNTIEFGGIASTISGGHYHTIRTNATSAAIGGGYGNVIGLGAYRATIAGGNENQIGDLAHSATIAGGEYNAIEASSYGAFVAAGTSNRIELDAQYAAIGGGWLNDIQPNGDGASIGGGFLNVIGTNARESTIGGGAGNSIREFAPWAVIAGGSVNTVGLAAAYATVSGGSYNASLGTNSTVPGGLMNRAAGDYSFAAGRRAKANHDGAFVWGDATDADIASTAANQFTIRAANGVRLPENAGAAKPVAVGEHYRDNALAAWGRCTSAGVISGDTFGVTSVTKVGTGRYDVVVTAVATGAGTLIPVAIAELDTQPVSAATVRIVSMNQTSASTFSVFINSGTFAAVDNDFVFMVTAR